MPARSIHPQNPAIRQGDARDNVLLPDIGVNLAAHPFQFVHIRDRLSTVVNRDAAFFLERKWMQMRICAVPSSM